MIDRNMDAGDTPGIDIVIPNWNGRHMLEICLASLASQTYSHFQVIVVDNGSGDGSGEFVASRYPDVHLIELHENTGFSAAVNRGIAVGTNDWVLLLNNDVEMDPDCLQNLVETTISEPDYLMFALKMVSFHERTTLDGAGDAVLRGGVGYRLGTMEPDSEHYDLKRRVFGACGGAALYHRSLFQSIGQFDERFFAYLEDVDLNMRAARAGYECCYVPRAVVYHVGSATSGSKINRLTVRLSTRNNIFVICKNYSIPLLIRFLPAILVYQFFWLLFVIKKKQFGAYVGGLWDAVPRIPQMWRHSDNGERSGRLSDRAFADRIVESERQAVGSIMARRRVSGRSNWFFRFYLALFC